MNYKQSYGNLILFEEYERNVLKCLHITITFDFVKKAQRNQLLLESKEYYTSLNDLIHIAKEISYKPALCNIIPNAHSIWWITTFSNKNRHIVDNKNYYFKQNDIKTVGLLIDVV